MKKEIVTPKEVDDVLGENIDISRAEETWKAICLMTKKKIRPSDVSVAVELFELGAAWQKERMYSRDDISVLIKDFIQFYTNRPEGSKKLSGVGQWLIDHKLEDK